MEKWDAYDGHLNKIDGLTLIRGEEIPDGIFHLCCEIIVKHNDGTYLLMQRDKRKHFGGMWEATAGGSALQGEDPLTCAIRELREETGIADDKLMEIGRVLHYGHQTYICAIPMLIKKALSFRKARHLLTNGLRVKNCAKYPEMKLQLRGYRILLKSYAECEELGRLITLP